MSRSGYTDDCENMGLWRGSVERAIRGKRGQAFLREMLTALDALPEKSLAANSFTKGGEICALGSVAVKRGIDVSQFEPPADADWYDTVDRHEVADTFGIAPAMAAEIMYENDEGAHWSKPNETPEERWQRMRVWILEQIGSPQSDAGKP